MVQKDICGLDGLIFLLFLVYPWCEAAKQHLSTTSSMASTLASWAVFQSAMVAKGRYIFRLKTLYPIFHALVILMAPSYMFQQLNTPFFCSKNVAKTLCYGIGGDFREHIFKRDTKWEILLRVLFPNSVTINRIESGALMY